VLLCCFILRQTAAGNFFAASRMSHHTSQRVAGTLSLQPGLDGGTEEQYGSWVEPTSRRASDYSWSNNTQFGLLVWSRLQNTLLLTVTATVLCWLIAVPAGAWVATSGKAGSRQLGWVDPSLLLATPELLILLIFQVTAAHSGSFAPGRTISVGASRMSSFDKDVGRHLFLPVTLLVLSVLPVLISHSASALQKAMESSFIKAGRANGIPWRRLLYRYALRSAAHPLISHLRLSVGVLLSASVLVESSLGWPGLGQLLVEATAHRDVDVVLVIVTVSAAFLAAGSFFADMLLYAADPRICQQ
jgi:peptide/nickel transport system permease protein